MFGTGSGELLGDDPSYQTPVEYCSDVCADEELADAERSVDLPDVTVPPGSVSAETIAGNNVVTVADDLEDPDVIPAPLTTVDDRQSTVIRADVEAVVDTGQVDNSAPDAAPATQPAVRSINEAASGAVNTATGDTSRGSTDPGSQPVPVDPADGKPEPAREQAGPDDTPKPVKRTKPDDGEGQVDNDAQSGTDNPAGAGSGGNGRKGPLDVTNSDPDEPEKNGGNGEGDDDSGEDDTKGLIPIANVFHLGHEATRYLSGMQPDDVKEFVNNLRSGLSIADSLPPGATPPPAGTMPGGIPEEPLEAAPDISNLGGDLSVEIKEEPYTDPQIDWAEELPESLDEPEDSWTADYLEAADTVRAAAISDLDKIDTIEGYINFLLGFGQSVKYVVFAKGIAGLPPNKYETRQYDIRYKYYVDAPEEVRYHGTIGDQVLRITFYPNPYGEEDLSLETDPVGGGVHDGHLLAIGIRDLSSPYRRESSNIDELRDQARRAQSMAKLISDALTPGAELPLPTEMEQLGIELYRQSCQLHRDRFDLDSETLAESFAKLEAAKYELRARQPGLDTYDRLTDEYLSPENTSEAQED